MQDIAEGSSEVKGCWLRVLTMVCTIDSLVDIVRDMLPRIDDVSSVLAYPTYTVEKSIFYRSFLLKFRMMLGKAIC